MQHNIFTFPLLKKTYFTITVLLFTIVAGVLSGTFKWIPIDPSIYYVQLAIFTLTSLSVILLMVFILPEMVPTLFKIEWKTNSVFLLLALTCCLTIAKFGVYALQYELSFFNPLLIKFFAIEIILVLTSLLIFRAKVQNVDEIMSVSLKEEPTSFKEQLNIKGELLNENLIIPVDELLYIKSSENYSEFYFITPQGISHKLMRMTLKSVEAQIPYDYMIRSHKSYVVNMSQVKSITGNANNAKLHFKNQDLSLPVSRSRRDIVIKVLASLPN